MIQIHIKYIGINEKDKEYEMNKLYGILLFWLVKGEYEQEEGKILDDDYRLGLG